MVPNKWDNFRLNSCILIWGMVKPLHKKIFSKLIFATTLAIYCNHIYIFFRNYIIIDYFVYSDRCSMLIRYMRVRIFCFIIYYLTLHVLRKHIMSYLCYLDMPPITYLLNSVNMIVTMNYVYV